jgi:hypothetical protein
MILWSDNRKFSEEIQIRELEIEKDTAEILDKTLIGPINQALQQMTGGKVCTGNKADGHLRIYKQAGPTAMYYAEFGDLEDVVRRSENDIEIACLPFRFFITGDIAYYCMCQGKEDSAGYHCNWCMLSSKEWQEKNHEKGIDWTIPKLEETASRLTAGTERIKVLSQNLWLSL